MSKGVLGNDPFKRGAAPSSPSDAPQPPKPAEPPKPLPVLTPQPPPKAKSKAPAPPPPPPKAAAPKVVLPKPKHGGSSPARRAVASLASEPHTREPGEQGPIVERLPTPSAAHPPPQEPVRAAPKPPPPPPRKPASVPPLEPPTPPPPPATPHEPIAHEGSPRLIHDPQAHAGSPTIGADPIGHAGSPELHHNPQPHDGSPEVRAHTTPHVGSPAVVARLDGKDAVAHESSPQVVSDRVATAADALGAARDVGEGLTRPFVTAAVGLYQAAKSALGFGSAGPVDTWGKDETLTRTLHPVGDFLYDRYFRVTVEGADLVPSGASIIVANHSGALPLDGPMLHYALQRERSDLESARWLVEDQVFHAPVLGVLMNRLGAVRAHPENAMRLLGEGRPVIVFPEGFLGISKPFTQRYQLKRFGRGGYVKLALRCKVQIVPVAIAGAEESMPLLAKIPAGALGLPYLPLTPPPLPARWRIRFSEPVDLSGGSEDDLAFVQQQNDRVRDTIAGMLESMVKG